MAGLIETIILRNTDLIIKKKQSIIFEKDFEGKGLLNKEISKLYDKKLSISEQQLEEIVINSSIIIDKMAQLKNCGWEIPELKSQLANGVSNYKKYSENESSNFKSGNTDKGKLLNATTIGKHFNISSQRLNLILSELGWIGKSISGWEVTKLGKSIGGKQYEYETNGSSYVLWPESILQNNNLTSGFKEVNSITETPKEQNVENDVRVIKSNTENFREKFPATFRTKDGHMVRSRAEVIIDNALYDYKLAHAYERKLPIEEELYSDFFIPTENVYIEFWGMENDPKYAERKKVKIAIYQKYDFKLIELTDDDITNLDDYLPKKLLKFGIKVY